jgi:hypothetical protein
VRIKSITEAYKGTKKRKVKHVRGEEFIVNVVTDTRHSSKLVNAVKDNPYVMSFESSSTPEGEFGLSVSIGVTSDKDPDKFINLLEKEVPLIGHEYFGYI